MIVELRSYRIQQGKARLWLDHYEKFGLQLQLRYLGCLIGFFSAQLDGAEVIKHMWGYASLDDREKRRAALFQDVEWKSYHDNIPPVVLSHSHELLVPTSFSPIR